jgi:hypothetical protein
MAYDSNVHEFDPETGYMISKDTQKPVGLVPRPVAQPIYADNDWPKWVTPHDSHIVRQKNDGAPDHVSTPAFGMSHVNRVDGGVSVLVHNEDEEKRATSEFKAPEQDDGESIDDRTRRQVAAEVDAHLIRQREAEAKKATEDRDRMIEEEAARRTAEMRDISDHARDETAKIAEESRSRIDDALGSPNRQEQRGLLSTATPLMPYDAAMAGVDANKTVFSPAPGRAIPAVTPTISAMPSAPVLARDDRPATETNSPQSNDLDDDGNHIDDGEV